MFIKLKFLPDYFPLILYPFYWLFLLSFYILYIPIYIIIWLFSPYKSKRSLIRYYNRKASKSNRVIVDEEMKEDTNHG